MENADNRQSEDELTLSLVGACRAGWEVMIIFQGSSGDSKLQRDFVTFISPQSFTHNWLTVRGQKDAEVGLVLGLEFIVSNQGTSVCYRCNLGGNQETQALYHCPAQC